MLALKYVLPARVRLCDCHDGVVSCATGRAVVRHPRLFQLRLERRLGAGGRSDRERGVRRVWSELSAGSIARGQSKWRSRTRWRGALLNSPLAA
jgi:hypothetical protein